MRSLQLGNVPDPDRSARLAAAAANVAAKAAQLEERRRDALHSLYMQAREFIVTEQQLDAKIEAVFVERPWAHVPGKEQAVNIWDAEGAPPTVQDMLGELNGTQRTAVGFHGGAAVATGKRMLRVAEELTGGKMD
jgi:predicted component of type VI protein secretion system